MIARLVLLVLLLASPAWATVHNVTTAGELTTALAAAVAGDEIVLANGTYVGNFATTNAGTSGSKIVIRAQNQHQAILEQSSQSCASSASATGLLIQDAHWTVQDLKFQVQTRAIHVSGVTGITITGNQITDFSEDGIRHDGAGATGNLIENNVIAYGIACVSNRDSAGVNIVTGSDSNTVRSNIIFATGNNGHTQGSVKNGYGVLIATNSDANLVQGNLLFANAGKGVLRLLAGGATEITLDNNKVYDNAFLWGEGENSTNDCWDDSTDYQNNIFVGVYQAIWSTKGNGDDAHGHHNLQHNFFWVDGFTRTGVGFGTGGTGCPSTNTKIDNVLQSNLFYSEETLTSGFHHLLRREGGFTEGQVWATRGNNLFFRNGGTDTEWVSGYTYQGSDVRSQPTFTDKDAGDFSLADGSAGKNAGHDGADIGIRYNGFLRKAWLAKAFSLGTQQNDGLTTSTSFTVSADHFYDVDFWIPASSPCSINETFTIEGANLTRDVGALTTGTTWTSTQSRWITLGRHKAIDGTLNISWTDSNCAEKIFIRQLPTVDEAYAWLALTDRDSGGLLGLKVYR